MEQLTIFVENPRLRRWQLTVPFKIVTGIRSGAELTQQLMTEEILNNLTEYLDTDDEFDDRPPRTSPPPGEPRRPGPAGSEGAPRSARGNGVRQAARSYPGSWGRESRTGGSRGVSWGDRSVSFPLPGP